ncbi:prepilin-type N-terminal cleavage/methylation domain-containing protein [Parelusimicrobium proximum]|uniref:type IV pilin protein n=1 Tax=Parelusimicrobium proximum TaxID=3228953 RepID=UPI003D16A71E
MKKEARARQTFFKSNILRTPSSSLSLYSVGFTLIELLVVVLIIAILAAVALPQYTAAVEKSRASEAFLNVKSVGTSAQRYILANDAFPTAFAQLDLEMKGTAISPAFMYNDKFIYYINTTARDVSACRINPARDNINTTPWQKADMCINFWVEDHPSLTGVKAGYVTCTANSSSAKYKTMSGVCRSLSGGGKIATDSGGWEYYKI